MMMTWESFETVGGAVLWTMDGRLSASVADMRVRNRGTAVTRCSEVAVVHPDVLANRETFLVEMVLRRGGCSKDGSMPGYHLGGGLQAMARGFTC